MAGAARAVRLERPGVAAAASLGCARRPSALLPQRVEERAVRVSTPCANERVSEWTRTSVPPSADRERVAPESQREPEVSAAAVTGFSGSRGKCGPIHGTPTTSASTGSSTVVPRSSTVRSSASACATEGVPANAGGGDQARELVAQDAPVADRREDE